MRIVVQRVERASVEVDGRGHAGIGPGLLVLLGVFEGDGDEDTAFLTEKVAHLRVFPDDEGRMNRSVLDIGGEVLIVPNFTLAGDARKGRRPSFDAAMTPDRAEGLFERFCESLGGHGVRVARGVFRAHMRIDLVNNGPVTLVIDSPA